MKLFGYSVLLVCLLSLIWAHDGWSYEEMTKIARLHNLSLDEVVEELWIYGALSEVVLDVALFAR